MKISLPEQGQPLDISYLSDIAKEINNLNTALSSTGTTSVIDNGINVPENVRTNNVKIYATTEGIQTGSVTAGSTQEWSVTFNPEFLYIPIVTATIQNNSGSTAGTNTAITISRIATGAVSGKILYNTEGSIDITINILAVGLSRWYNLH